jgi:hypothetical protein
MDRFYRAMRKQTGLLIEGGKPIGGKFSYDHENRKPFRGEVLVPNRPTYPPDEITSEVLRLVERQFPNHFGSLEGFDLPVTARDCRAFWNFALTHLLPNFGPWEDAMATNHPDLFHSKLSALMNLGRLLPREAVNDVATAHGQGKIRWPVPKDSSARSWAGANSCAMFIVRPTAIVICLCPTKNLRKDFTQVQLPRHSMLPGPCPPSTGEWRAA